MMSAVLKSAPARVAPAIGEHSTLIGYTAKGLFFLRMAMTEHTDGPNLLQIARRATEMYNATINEKSLCYQPVFKFRVVDDEHLELQLFREGRGSEDDVCQGRIKLAFEHRPAMHGHIIVLDPSETTLH
jgi:hypothetical protein